MNPLEQLNDAMGYLEENLNEEASFAKMASIAGCSEYHFRRVFSYLAGMPLGEYVRKRKLAVAVDLLRGGLKVIDCATLLGYESADSFGRAFKEMHGISPTQAKSGNSPTEAFPPLRFQLTLQGGKNMVYRIEHCGSFTLAGFKKRITLQFVGANPQIDSLVEKLTPARIAELKGINDTEPPGMLSASAGFESRLEEGSELDQYIAVATTQAVPPGYDSLKVDESDWAVFEAAGAFPDEAQSTWARIFSEWLPSSRYELVEGPELLRHIGQDLASPDHRCEIWIPVRKR